MARKNPLSKRAMAKVKHTQHFNLGRVFAETEEITGPGNRYCSFTQCLAPVSNYSTRPTKKELIQVNFQPNTSQSAAGSQIKPARESMAAALMADPEIAAISDAAAVARLAPEILAVARVIIRSRQQSPTPLKTVVNADGNESPFKS